MYKVLRECRYVHRDAIFTIHQQGQVAVTGTRGSTKPEIFMAIERRGFRGRRRLGVGKREREKERVRAEGEGERRRKRERGRDERRNRV